MNTNVFKQQPAAFYIRNPWKMWFLQISTWLSPAYRLTVYSAELNWDRHVSRANVTPQKA